MISGVIACTLGELREFLIMEADHEILLTAAGLMLHILYTLWHHVTNHTAGAVVIHLQQELSFSVLRQTVHWTSYGWSVILRKDMELQTVFSTQMMRAPIEKTANKAATLPTERAKLAHNLSLLEVIRQNNQLFSFFFKSIVLQSLSRIHKSLTLRFNCDIWDQTFVTQHPNSWY